MRLVNLAIKKASTDKGNPISVAVVGIDGQPIVFATMDGAWPIARDLAINKAHSAIQFGWNTRAWNYEPPLDVTRLADQRFTTLPGGVLIKTGIDSLTVGAIGVSGRTSGEDNELAEEVALEASPET